ncbi:uncharacterized protein EDB93DRAFT_1103785 [Suillus bovinus]|uniref:uncharacterized protein n=1 Tax=Suillus bovinus TaxID=48563 RepID=UPI001B883EA1|nr:uncharacterized protein EDB93DRAFT_1103785 [Suillus bovinus]KAG2148743.1 hypothetical protein EDB93DRAFT_1103785 [Suillus bovinus]
MACILSPLPIEYRKANRRPGITRLQWATGTNGQIANAGNKVTILEATLAIGETGVGCAAYGTYRVKIPTENLLQDSDLRLLIEKSKMVDWRDGWVCAACNEYRAQREYNLVMIYPDGGEEPWTVKSGADKMRVELLVGNPVASGLSDGIRNVALLFWALRLSQILSLFHVPINPL